MVGSSTPEEDQERGGDRKAMDVTTVVQWTTGCEIAQGNNYAGSVGGRGIGQEIAETGEVMQ